MLPVIITGNNNNLEADIMNNKEFGTVIGTFGKGIQGSVTVNFSQSGGEHCDDSCSLKGNGCYACTTERMKPSINVNLIRKESNKENYLAVLASEKAIAKLSNAPWVRFSAFGSIYKPDSITPEMFQHLREIASALDHNKVHFPVETFKKANVLTFAGFKPRVSMGECSDTECGS